MSHEQRFQARLKAQFQEAGARILGLEATLAQKDDQIAQKESQVANLNAQIQRMMTSSASGNGQQHMTTAMQTQINQANTRVMSAENTLKQSVRNWNKYQAQWHQEKQELWKQVQHQKLIIEDLRKENMALRSSGGSASNADMETMVKNYKALEKQFEAHKKHDSQLKNFPASAKGKAVAETGADDDEDDEETHIPSLKQEPAEDHAPDQPAATSHEILPYDPPQQAVPQASMSHRPSTIESTAQIGPALNSHRPSFAQQRAAFAARAASTASSITGPSIVPATPPTAFAEDQYIPPTPMPYRQDSQANHPSTKHRSRANAVDLSAADSTTRAVKRRRESEQDEIKTELQGLTITDPASRANLKIQDPQARTRQGSRRSGPLEIINLCESPSPDPPTKRQRNSNGGSYATAPIQNRKSTRPDIQDRIKYKAVVSQSQGRNASISYLDSVEDLADVAEDLWEQIIAVHDLWEEAKGDDWKYEFEVKLKNQDCKQCVSSKLKIEGRESGKSKWRPGCECLYACSQCVSEGKPCFVWTENESRLLPLHDEDRVWPVEEGCEVRRWINVE